MSRGTVGLVASMAIAWLAAAGAPGIAQTEEPPHSSSVADAWHQPSPTPRGAGVTVHLRLHNGTGVLNVTLIYCRAENYACAPSLAMHRTGDASFQAPIQWHPGFFRGAQNVGYNFTLRRADGPSETSPLHSWPYTPTSLPPDAGRYYFYPLMGDDGAPIPAPPALLLFGAIMGATLTLRRRDHA